MDLISGSHVQLYHVRILLLLIKILVRRIYFHRYALNIPIPSNSIVLWNLDGRRNNNGEILSKSFEFLLINAPLRSKIPSCEWTGKE